jgi:hypothetical protein
MTRVVDGEWLFSQRWKRCATLGLYAALKRRSFTVVLAAVVVSSVQSQRQDQQQRQR